MWFCVLVNSTGYPYSIYMCVFALPVATVVPWRRLK